MSTEHIAERKGSTVMFNKGDIVRVIGANQWNGENYTVTKVFQNVEDPTQRLIEIRWVEPHTHNPRSALVEECGFILAPQGKETPCPNA